MRKLGRDLDVFILIFGLLITNGPFGCHTNEIYLKLMKNPGLFIQEYDPIFAESFVKIYFTFPITDDNAGAASQKVIHPMLDTTRDNFINDFDSSAVTLFEETPEEKNLYEKIKSGGFWKTIKDPFLSNYYKKLFGMCRCTVPPCQFPFYGRLDQDIISKRELIDGIKPILSVLEERGVELSIGLDELDKYYNPRLTSCEELDFESEQRIDILLHVRIPIRRKNLKYQLFKLNQLGWQNGQRDGFCKISSNSYLLKRDGKTELLNDNSEQINPSGLLKFCNPFDFGLCLVPRGYVGDENPCYRAVEAENMKLINEHCTSKYYCTPYIQPQAVRFGDKLYVTNAYDTIQVKCSNDESLNQVLVDENEKKNWLGTLEIINFPFCTSSGLGGYCELIHGQKKVAANDPSILFSTIWTKVRDFEGKILEDSNECKKFNDLDNDQIKEQEPAIIIQRIPAIWAGITEESEEIPLESVLYRNQSGQIEVVGTTDGLKPIVESETETNVKFYLATAATGLASIYVIKRIWHLF